MSEDVAPKGDRWTLPGRLAYTAKYALVPSAILMLINVIATLAAPAALRLLVQALEERSYDALYFALALGGASAVGVLSNSHTLFLTWHMGQQLRALVVSEVYAALLRLPASALADGAADKSKAATPAPNPDGDKPQGDKKEDGASKESSSTGLVGTIIANGAQQVFEVCQFIHMLWAAPLLIVGASTFLLLLLGPSALAGIAALLLMVPMKFWLFSLLMRARQPRMKHTDKRVGLTSEIVAGMRAIKSYGWETSYLASIRRTRSEEHRLVSRENLLYGSTVFLLIVLPVVSTVVTMVVYSAVEGDLQPSTAFGALAYFTALRFPLNQLAALLSTAARVRVALERVQAFLDRATGAPETGTVEGVGEAPAASPGIELTGRPARRLTSGQPAKGVDEADSPVLSVKGAEFYWQAREPLAASQAEAATVARAGAPPRFRVGPVSLDLQAGQLLAVVGSIGAGKSTFLQGLLGETADSSRSSGLVRCPSVTAYCPQEPWILNATLRDNITFGRPWVSATYKRVLWASGLQPDLTELQAGDLSVIGERGVVLSGGQKARVGLARAAYACLVDMSDECDEQPALESGQGAGAPPQSVFAHASVSAGQLPGLARVVLLDGVLSALDGHTGQHVYEQLIGPRGLLRHTARVIVTHSMAVASQADSVLVLRRGQTAFCGPPADVPADSAAMRVSGVREMVAMAARGPTAPVLVGDQEGAGSAEGAADESGGENGATAAAEAVSLAEVPAAEAAAAAAPAAAAPAAAAAAAAREARHEEDEGASGGSSNAEEGSAGAELWSGVPLSTTMGQLAQVETRQAGRLSWAVIGGYLRAAGGWPMLLLLVLVLSTERFTYGSVDVWLGLWTSAAADPQGRPPEGLLHLPDLTDKNRLPFWALIYALIATSNLLVVAVRTHLVPAVVNRASFRLFDRLVGRLMRAKISFYETTPLGRIISRLSYDTEVVDVTLLSKLNPTISSVFWLLNGLVLIIGTQPWAVTFLVPMLIGYFWLLVVYTRTSRELQRIDATARSPVQAHASETISGLTTLRAFGASPLFSSLAEHKLDNSSRAMFATLSTARWLNMRLDLTGTVTVLLVGIIAWALRASIAPGIAAITLIWANNLPISLNFLVSSLTELEQKMTSVERIFDYVDNVPQEAPLEGTDPCTLAVTSAVPVDNAVAAKEQPQHGAPQEPRSRGGCEWPSRGAVDFDSVVLRYRPGLPPALRGLSLAVRGGEKVAIVGRTGAGKSTVSVALFRLVELEAGSISVDGVDLAKLGLSDVRGRHGGICQIPQDPTILGGTVRSTLDPFGAYDDRAIWHALQTAGVDMAVARLSRAGADDGRPVTSGPAAGGGGPQTAREVSAEEVRLLGAEERAAALSGRVPEGGKCFSVGERQLLCLARALLRRPRVLLLDEATSAADPATDALVQRTLRKEFAGATLLTIAHRVSTIMDYDRVVVLELGQIVEQGPPGELAADPSTRFSVLARAAQVHAHEA